MVYRGQEHLRRSYRSHGLQCWILLLCPGDRSRISVAHLSCTLSPPPTARSIRSFLPWRPRALAKSFRFTVVPAPLSKITFTSRTFPFAALNWTRTTGMILSLYRTDVSPLLVGGSGARDDYFGCSLSCGIDSWTRISSSDGLSLNMKSKGGGSSHAVFSLLANYQP